MDDGATVGALRALLEAQFKVPDADQTLSLDQRLVRASQPRPQQRARLTRCASLRRTAARVRRVRLPRHGGPKRDAALAGRRPRLAGLPAVLCGARSDAHARPRNAPFWCAVSARASRLLARASASAARHASYSRPPTAWPGAHMTIAEMVLKQTRIERQDKPRCASLSFDGQAANVFQACVRRSLVRAS